MKINIKMSLASTGIMIFQLSLNNFMLIVSKHSFTKDSIITHFSTGATQSLLTQTSATK